MWDGKLSYNAICIVGSSGRAFNSTTQDAEVGRFLRVQEQSVYTFTQGTPDQAGLCGEITLQNQKLNNNSNTETLTRYNSTCGMRQLWSSLCAILMNLGNEESNPSALPCGNILAQRWEKRVKRPEDQENIAMVRCREG